MPHRTPPPALLLVLLAAAPVAAEAPAPAPGVTYGPWVRVRDEAGIVVQRRTVSNSALGEFRGEGRIEAPIERVFAVIRDADRRTEWMANCAESRFVERGEQFQVLYNRTKAPWPAWDRDVVLRGTIRLDVEGRALWVLFHETTHATEPAREGVMRMPFLRGHWRLTAEAGNTRTFAEYQVHADPGGHLPAWIANLVSAGVPFKTLQQLRAQVAKASYPEYEAAFRLRPGFPEIAGTAAPAP